MTLTHKTLAAVAVALSAITVAAPAMAQPGGYYDRYERHDRHAHGGWSNGVGYGRDRVRHAEHRIEVGLRSGRLTGREASRLRNELIETIQFEIDLRRGGLSWREAERVDRRWDNLMAEIRDQSRDRQWRDDRDYGYGYGWRR